MCITSDLRSKNYYYYLTMMSAIDSMRQLKKQKRRAMAAVVLYLLTGLSVVQAFVAIPRPSSVRPHRVAVRVERDTTSPAVAVSFDNKKAKKPSFDYTHLEINGMIWKFPGTGSNSETTTSIVVDPIASQLDFGIAPLYRANKKFLSESQTLHLIEQANPTHVLLSQGLEDHAHGPTIRKLVERLPHLHYIVPPSAYDKVAAVVPNKENIHVLRHGQEYRLNEYVTVTATVGSLVGPPWQERENGYLLQAQSSAAAADENDTNDAKLSVYYEPHGDTEPQQLRLVKNKDNNNNQQTKKIRADICILPVTEQSLPAQLPPFARFPLVHGTQRMQRIVQAIQPQCVIPLMNGDLHTDGALSQLVASRGSIEEFQRQVQAQGVQVERPIPGQSLTVQVQ